MRQPLDCSCVLIECLDYIVVLTVVLIDFRTLRMDSVVWSGGLWLVTITSCHQSLRTWLFKNTPTWSSPSSHGLFVLECQLLIWMHKEEQEQGEWNKTACMSSARLRIGKANLQYWKLWVVKTGVCAKWRFSCFVPLVSA